MPRNQDAKASGPKPGGFTLRGSWSEEVSPDSPMTHFVQTSRRERVHPGLSPADFCERIPEAFRLAFPNRESWSRLTEWPDCRTSTSAESTVVYAFQSKFGDPRPVEDTYDPDAVLSHSPYLGHVTETAARINKGCAHYGINDPQDPRRIEVHRLHGQLVSNGIDDPQEIIRVVASRLKVLSERSNLSVHTEA